MAEVLITLGIIGIVVAMTIPSLVGNYRERQNIIKLKQIYSIFSNALALTIDEHGTLDQWGDDSKEFFEQEFVKHLNVVRTCNRHATDCGGKLTWNVLPAYVLNNGVAFNVPKRIQNDPGGPYYNCSVGVSYVAKHGEPHYEYCARIVVDLNGLGGPNIEGIDTFEFRVYKDGILPNGFNESSSGSESFATCKNNKGHSLQCTAWAFVNENMDYLRCPDELSWKGAKGCKSKK